ncbi:MAG: hypothetical protein RLZZ507_799 [Cyanobacteriota bacterium]|jgi:hypothetical protein
MKTSITKLLGITLIVTSITLFTNHIQAEENKPQIRRPKPSFFEQERKQKFGFADFVNSALDGVDTFFGADNTAQSILANPVPSPGGPTSPGTSPGGPTSPGTSPGGTTSPGTSP